LTIAYSSDSWVGFGTAAATAAAALAGLLFIAVSINLRQILAVKSLPSRAAQTLITFGTALVTGLLVVVPDQARNALAAELIATGVVIGGWQLHLDLSTDNGGEYTARRRLLGAIFPALTTCGCLVVAGATLVAQAGGGLYWVVPGVISAFGFGLINVWVLLVEILR